MDEKCQVPQSVLYLRPHIVKTKVILIPLSTVYVNIDRMVLPGGWERGGGGNYSHVASNILTTVAPHNNIRN